MALGEVYGTRCMNCDALLRLNCKTYPHRIVFFGTCEACKCIYRVEKYK